MNKIITMMRGKRKKGPEGRGKEKITYLYELFSSFADDSDGGGGGGGQRKRENERTKRREENGIYEKRAAAEAASIAEQRQRTCVHGGGEYKVLFSKFMIVNKF